MLEMMKKKQEVLKPVRRLKNKKNDEEDNN